MSQTQDSQPAKKRNWFARHKILTAIGVLTIFAIIGSSGGGGSKNASNTTATPTPAPTVVETKAFADEFNANQVAAESKYKGKTVQLTATISNITDSGLSFSNVSSKEFDITQIACNIKNKDDVLSLRNGQSVTVAGTVDGQTIGVITLKDCSIAK